MHGVPSFEKEMRESNSIIPSVINVNIIVVRKKAQLHGHENDFDNLNGKFVREATFGLPFFNGIHEKEPQPPSHFVLHVGIV